MSSIDSLAVAKFYTKETKSQKNFSNLIFSFGSFTVLCELNIKTLLI